MGLAASQARLLTITSRKADCECQSMRLSHQKLALARETSEISNEYENSLNQTKLYYDYYGIGDTSNPLNYNLLMTPSALNDYLPTLITNQQGRVVLDSAYAAAARYAGIPQEGLGSLPGSDVRDKFIDGLYMAGLITENEATSIKKTTYNQAAGLGCTDMSSTIVQEMTLSELTEYLQYSGDSLSVYVPTDTNRVKELYKDYGNDTTGSNPYIYTKLYDKDGNQIKADDVANLSVYDLLNGEDIYLRVTTQGCHGLKDEQLNDAYEFLEDLIYSFEDYFGALLDTSDGITSMALAYATDQCLNEFFVDNVTNGTCRVSNDNDNKDITNESDVIGWANTYHHNTGTTRPKAQASINLSNLLRAYLTYFAEYMEGIANPTNPYSVDANNYTVASNLIDDDYVFRVVVGGTDADSARLALFYDTLFNQLCTYGWTENDEITDQDYMQDLLKSGMVYISSCSDDGYYYQGNYSTNTFIKEFSDDSAIAQAEARYTTQKAKLSAKEDEIDLKMNNLDTEISSLTTEYDTVKSVISKNIEKSFKRYSA